MTKLPPYRQVFFSDIEKWLKTQTKLRSSVVFNPPSYRILKRMNVLNTWDEYKQWIFNILGLICSKMRNECYIVVVITNEIDENNNTLNKFKLINKFLNQKKYNTLNTCRLNKSKHFEGFTDYYDVGFYHKNNKIINFKNPQNDHLESNQGIEVECANSIVKTLKKEGCITIGDVFCGHGTILRAANKFGLNSWGIDINPNFCAKARI